MLAGRAPFQDAESLGDLIVSICSAQTPPLQDFAPWVPRDIAAIVHACLVPDRSRRFASARDMTEVLLSVLPEGDKLTKDMLVGATDAEREHVAARFDVSGSGADVLELSGSIDGEDNPMAASPNMAHSNTAAAAVTDVQSSASKGGFRAPLVVAVGVGLVAGAYGVYTLTTSGGDVPVDSSTATSAVPTSSAAAPVEVKPSVEAKPVVSAPPVTASASASAATPPPKAAPPVIAAPVNRPAAPVVRKPKVVPPPAVPPPVRRPPVRTPKATDPFGGRK